MIKTNKNLKHFLIVSVFTIALIYGLISLMDWTVNQPQHVQKEDSNAYYRASDNKQFALVDAVVLKDVKGNITLVDADYFRYNYYQTP